MSQGPSDTSQSMKTIPKTSALLSILFEIRHDDEMSTSDTDPLRYNMRDEMNLGWADTYAEIMELSLVNMHMTLHDVQA